MPDTEEVRLLIAQSAGLTFGELCERLGKSEAAVKPLFRELRRTGEIVDSGMRRLRVGRGRPEVYVTGTGVVEPARPRTSCFACGGEAWWVRSDGGRVCGGCHPPVKVEES